MAHPLVENGVKETSPRLRSDAEGRHFSNGAFYRGGKHAAIRMTKIALHDWSKLNVTATNFLEKAIELKRTLYVDIVDNGHGVPHDIVSVECSNAPHHLFPRSLSETVSAIAVVHVLRAVNRDTYKKIVFLEKASPFIRDESSVGLKAIINMLVSSIFPLQLQRPFIKFDRAHHWFSAMPREKHTIGCLQLDILFGEFLKKFVCDEMAFALGIKVFLFEIIAIVAGQIAACACRFDHDVDGVLKGDVGFGHDACWD